MPWMLSQVIHKTKKATTAKLKRQWLHVANGELADHGDEKRAIRAADSVIAAQVKRDAAKPKRKAPSSAR